MKGVNSMSALVAVNSTTEGTSEYTSTPASAVRAPKQARSQPCSGNTPSAPTAAVARDSASASRVTSHDITHSSAMGPGGCTLACIDRYGRICPYRANRSWMVPVLPMSPTYS